jgi:hypothetical protein
METAFAGAEGPAPDREGSVVEVPLLLSAAGAAALEREAHRRGLTAGQLLRLLVRDFLGATPDASRLGDLGVAGRPRQAAEPAREADTTQKPGEGGRRA